MAEDTWQRAHSHTGFPLLVNLWGRESPRTPRRYVLQGMGPGEGLGCASVGIVIAEHANPNTISW